MSKFCIELEGMMLPDAIAAVVEAWYEAQNVENLASESPRKACTFYLPPVTPETTSMDAPDLTLPECCERWRISSRNSVKARAAAIGVQLRREGSTRTVWPREDVPLGDELHEHLNNGGTLRDFPGAMPQPAKPAPRDLSWLTKRHGI